MEGHSRRYGRRTSAAANVQHRRRPWWCDAGRRRVARRRPRLNACTWRTSSSTQPILGHSVGSGRACSAPSGWLTSTQGSRRGWRCRRVQLLTVLPAGAGVTGWRRERLHLDIRGTQPRRTEVERLLALGATYAEVGHRQEPSLLLVDPEGNTFRLMEGGPEHPDAGSLMALRLDAADPDRELDFWSWLTGWMPVAVVERPSLQHPSGAGLFSSCSLKRRPKGPGRTGCISTSASRATKASTRPPAASPNAAVASSRSTGATCRGGPSRTRRATSSACCRRVTRADSRRRRRPSRRLCLRPLGHHRLGQPCASCPPSWRSPSSSRPAARPPTGLDECRARRTA